jgi:putative membrane protein
MSKTSNSDGLGLLVLVAVALLVGVPLVGMGAGMLGVGHMGGGMWAGSFSGWMLTAAIAVQLIFLLVIGVAVYLVYRMVVGSGSTGEDDPAIEELRRAYARGDLSQEEYERRHEELDGE